MVSPSVVSLLHAADMPLGCNRGLNHSVLCAPDMKIRRPGYWTVHPTFSNNVVVANNSIITTGSNTDGVSYIHASLITYAHRHFMS